MTDAFAEEAVKPNPALEPLHVLIGAWRTVGSHPMMPGITLHGRTTFEWVEGGAFVRMRSEVDEPGIPSAIAFLGTDDTTGECSMLYFDERGVSRRYEVRVHDQLWQWWRNAPGFFQRFRGTIAADGRTIVGEGEMSRDNGQSWQGDLQLTYTRER